MNAEVVVTTAQAVIINAEIKVNRTHSFNTQQLTTINAPTNNHQRSN
ncbi:hypothetical protein [Tolypothrix sp. VBCCA 56010]